jgi:DNA-binding transcriptional ArsR family regulator
MEQTIKLIKSLSDPTRLRIMAMCRHGGDLTVSEIVRILGQSQPRVSRHLKLLPMPVPWIVSPKEVGSSIDWENRAR